MMQFLKYAAYILALVGAINWGLIGIFGFNLVGTLFGDMTVLSRIVYTIIGVSGIVTALTVHPCELEDELDTCEYGRCNI